MIALVIVTVRLIAGSSATGHLIANAIFAVSASLVVGYLLTQLVQHYRHRDELRPRFAVIGHVYSPQPGGDLTWDGAPVEHICRTVVVLWNGGTRTITATDLSADAPICVEVNGRVLDYAVLPPAAGAHVEPMGSALRVTFTALKGNTLSDIDAPRGFCVQIVHDSPGWEPAISGLIGTVSLTDEDRHNRPLANPRRGTWTFILAGLGFIGSSAWEWVSERPDWLDRNFTLRADLGWTMLLLVAVAVTVGVLAYYSRNLIRYGRSFTARSGDYEYNDGNKSQLWFQRVPYAFRGRQDITEASFWRANAGRWGSSQGDVKRK